MPEIDDIRRCETEGAAKRRAQFDRAIDMMEERQIDIYRAELQRRFPASYQSPQAGQEILPVTIPLTDRFVVEQANAYRKPPRRYFVGDDGNESDETRKATDALAKMLDEARYNEAKLKSERLSVLCKTSCEWYGAKRGKLSMIVTLPQNVYPVRPSNLIGFDQQNPDDYPGFVVDMSSRRHSEARQYAALFADRWLYFKGAAPNEPTGVEKHYTNPFDWEQTDDAGKESEAPGQMLTFWHDGLPITGGLIPVVDSSISELNVEINVCLSALIDNIKFQGHAIPVKKLENTTGAAALQRHGVRFPVVLSIAESFEMASAATNYMDQVQVLRELVRMLAVSKRLPPGDVSTEGPSPQSGFAKAVESLPKIERREERIMQLRSQEVQVARPRLLSIGVFLGKLDASVWKMGYRVEFPDVEFPRTEQERTVRLDTDIKYGLTTPAKILAVEKGITLKQADAEIKENTKTEMSGENPNEPKPRPEEKQRVDLLGFGSQIRKKAREE